MQCAVGTNIIFLTVPGKEVRRRHSISVSSWFHAFAEIDYKKSPLKVLFLYKVLLYKYSFKDAKLKRVHLITHVITSCLGRDEEECLSASDFLDRLPFATLKFENNSTI